MEFFRQGDVYLIPVKSLPENCEKITSEKDVILAYGEVTGHAHRISETQKATIWSVAGERYLQVIERSLLTHEEHSPITLPPGIYHLPSQYEYSPRALRRVED